jgi:excisionase family DNA binding protein
VLTVHEAATRAEVSDETVRRWLRSGRLAGHRDGPRHLIDPAALDALRPAARSFPLPDGWIVEGKAPGPDWVALVRRLRGIRER